MARLQILELPEGAGDDRPPFILVISEAPTGPDGLPLISHRDRRDTADLIGARAVLVFEDTIDIPANEITLSDATDGNIVRIRVEPDLEGFRERVEEEALYAQGKITRALDREEPADG